VSRLRVVRTQALTTAEQIEAIFTHPTLYRLAAAVPFRQPVGRPPLHPAWSLLGYGVLARVFRSGARTEAELASPGVWPRILDLVEQVRHTHPDLDIPAGNSKRAPDWAGWKNARNRYFTEPEVLALMQDVFSEAAVEQAHQFGLLTANGPGSLCHPDSTRVVYGDGTVIRPMYRPPAATRSTDPTTGEVTITYLDPDGNQIDKPTRRFDPDAADYHGHTGSVHGQNYVGLYVRGTQAHQRVVLAVDRVPRPGLEADTATARFQHIHPLLGAGVQAFVYDGAIRGKHIDQLMTTCGVLVINKVHGTGAGRASTNAAKNTPPKPTKAKPTKAKASRKTPARRRPRQPHARWFTLGTWEHHTPDGTACPHHLAAIDGAVHEVTLDDAGAPTPLTRLERRQVKRPRRSTGRYHFNVGYEVPCPAAGAFLAWVTPHAEPGDNEHRRADAVRVIPEGDTDFAVLYGLRNDSESFNSQLKRTLLVDRAMSLGAQRQLLDVLCFAVLNNTTNAYRARRQDSNTTASRTTASRTAESTAFPDAPRLDDAA
jgi:hypothetical protein